MNRWLTFISAAVACTVISVQAAPLKGENPKRNAELAKEWAKVGKLPNFWEGTWQGISPLYMFPGPVEYTQATKEYLKAYKPPDDTAYANCQAQGMPFAMHQGAMPIKFYPALDHVAIYIESFAATRFIWTDGRPATDDVNPTFLGTSVGHWEGDTLVVDSRGFVDETVLQIGTATGGPSVQGASGPPGMPMPLFKQHGPNLRFVERMRMLDYNNMEIETTIYDDTIFAKPYVSTRKWHRYTGHNSEPKEWVCSGNRDYFDEKSGELQIHDTDKAISK